MTVIVGLVDKGNVYLGGDSAGVGGLSITIRKDRKVFVNGPFIMGFTTSFRMGNLLQYKFKPAEQKVDQTDMEYMNTTFIDEVRKLFKDNGFGSGSDGNGGNFLVGYKGQLYNIHGDFQVGLSMAAFDAVGCGSDLSLGAMYANPETDPIKKIKKALEAAATFSAGVAAPFHIIKQLSKPAKKQRKK